VYFIWLCFGFGVETVGVETERGNVRSECVFLYVFWGGG
jgi:hypothetical protein